MIKRIVDFRKAANLPEKITILSIAEKTVPELFSFNDEKDPSILVASTSDLIQAREDLLNEISKCTAEGWIFAEPCYQHNDMYVVRGYRLENKFISPNEEN